MPAGLAAAIRKDRNWRGPMVFEVLRESGLGSTHRDSETLRVIARELRYAGPRREEGLGARFARKLRNALQRGSGARPIRRAVQVERVEVRQELLADQAPAAAEAGAQVVAEVAEAAAEGQVWVRIAADIEAEELGEEIVVPVRRRAPVGDLVAAAEAGEDLAAAEGLRIAIESWQLQAGHGRPQVIRGP
jgi:hypothetical protein